MRRTNNEIEHWCQTTRAFEYREWDNPEGRAVAAKAILEGASRCGACAWFLDQRGNRTRVREAVKKARTVCVMDPPS